MDFSGVDGPGPGEYEPYSKPEVVMEHAHLNTEDKTQFESNIPRYHEMVVKDEEKKVWKTLSYLFAFIIAFMIKISIGECLTNGIIMELHILYIDLLTDINRSMVELYSCLVCKMISLNQFFS